MIESLRPHARRPGLRGIAAVLSVLVVPASCGDDPVQPPAPPVPTALAFTAVPWPRVNEGELLEPIVVRVTDGDGEMFEQGDFVVTLALDASAPAGLLQGTTSVTTIDGVATFDDVRITRDARELRLTASSAGLDDVTSLPFDASIRFEAIDAGGVHSCGLRVGGEMLCWGDNATGRLGTGDPWRSTLPAPVAGERRWASISAGSPATCALTTEGAAWCWGQVEVDRFVATPEEVGGGHVFARIVTNWHTCALTAAGSAYCWGSNESHQLGAGTDEYSIAEPLPVVGGHVFTAISPGMAHTCAVDTDGVAWCWGNNPSGELGDGETTPRGQPEPVLTEQRFVDIGAGNDHSCALTGNGEVWCWGSNAELQLGRSDVDGSTIPVKVSGVRRFTKLSVGAAANCGIEVGGGLYCWGRNTNGLLGNGTQENSAAPVRVQGSMLFEDVDAGGWHTCGRTADGDGYCWGDPSNGAIGIEYGITSVPARVEPRAQ